MNKPLCVISCPINTYSGYGARSRDIVKSIIELKKDEWDVKIIPQRWGDTSQGFIEDNHEWSFLNEYLHLHPQLPKQPEIFIQHTVPNEFQPIGKYNIGITAGIESDISIPEWIEGLNRMNTTWVSSKHAKTVFENSKFEKKDQQGRTVGVVQLEKPIEVIFEGADLNTYKLLDKSEITNINLDSIKEDFCFLFIGHWMQGDIGEDRKNVGLLVKSFFEIFKNKQNKPALILKSSGAVSSYMDRDMLLKRIDQIKQTVNSKDLPNIYLLHGDFTDKEINELYNHPKVKAMVSLTKGEGFGRPLLEFSLLNKPVIASNWSGHLDFLNSKYSVLINGELKQVHPSTVNQFLIRESKWFSPHYHEIGETLTNVYKRYDKYLPDARKQSEINREKFSYEAMKNLVKEHLDKVPTFARQVELKLPNLKTPTMKQIQLPKLTKIQ